MQINQSNLPQYNTDKTAFGARLFKTNIADKTISEMGSGFKANLEDFYAPYIEQINCNGLPVNTIIDVAKRKILGFITSGKKFIIKTQLQDAPHVSHTEILDIPNLFFRKFTPAKESKKAKSFANEFYEKINWSANNGLPETPEYISGIADIKAANALNKSSKRSVKNK